ncbi:MAG: prepilin-type N-terminal cleavage/methylation domain-containing protein [Butyrivibrio sp.]|nr:prepilin-type N-terminal cleavage/methylation domain-containing protein [Butyrivibrio sp.]MCM1263916.1 prepilin-type N-terminal cleavage/methylation domain-containing protein [Butyrivibrio sp.]
MKQDNKGYSLVEIIIVIAIMVILSGGVFFSIYMVFGANAKTCANDIKNAISQCKVNAMGKSDAALEIYRDSSNQCIYARQWIKEGDDWQSKDAEKISNAKVYVSYTKDSSNSGTRTYDELDGTKSIFIAFDRGSGAFKPSKKPGATGEDDVYTGFIVVGGTRKYTIELVGLTGKVSVTAGVNN